MAEALLSLIHKKRSAIITKWFDSTVYAYAPDTAAFLKSQKAQLSEAQREWLGWVLAREQASGVRIAAGKTGQDYSTR